MSNIGYAIFKKKSNLILDSNGLFEELKLENIVSSIIDTIDLKEVGQNLLCFKRISSVSINNNSKDAYLIALFELVKHDNELFILGSAICFNRFQVNSNKIIDGVHYLLKQLKQNYSIDYPNNDKDLGVLLPSTNKDFKILKAEKLKYIHSEKYVKGFDQVLISGQEVFRYLDHFCNNKLLYSIDVLYLSSSVSLLQDLSRKGFKKIDVKALLDSEKQLKQNEALPRTETVNFKAEKERDEAILEKEKIEKGRNLFRVLSIVFFLGMITFLGLFITGNKKEALNITEIYPINEKVYISHSNYNVNVRSTPVFDKDDRNIKTTLSDGDEVVLIGFDKKTFWAKISYNNGSDIGYVSNRLVSKNIDNDRILPVNRKMKIGYTYNRVALYESPKEIGKEYPKILLYLSEKDEVFIKNKDLRLNSYSVSFQKNNKTYHGYVEEQYIN